MGTYEKETLIAGNWYLLVIIKWKDSIGEPLTPQYSTEFRFSISLCYQWVVMTANQSNPKYNTSQTIPIATKVFYLYIVVVCARF